MEYLTDDEVLAILKYAKIGDGDGVKWNIANTVQITALCVELMELRGKAGIKRNRDEQEDEIPF